MNKWKPEAQPLHNDAPNYIREQRSARVAEHFETSGQSRDLTSIMEINVRVESSRSCHHFHQKIDTLQSINPPFPPKFKFLASFPPNPKSIRSAGPGRTPFQPRVGWYGEEATFSSHESRSSTGKLGRTGGNTSVAFLASGGERLNDERVESSAMAKELYDGA